MKKFLTTRWTNLINITYTIDPEILKPHLASDLELDLINGKAFVSVVAFEFSNTKIKGIRFPFHVHFPEINLRFYVRHKGRRGIVFIKEFVSKFLVGAIANLTYNEHFSIVPLCVRKIETTSELSVFYRMKIQNEWQELSATAENKTFKPLPGSPEHFFEEQHFGFGRDRQKNTFVFEVEHPEWEVYPLKAYNISFDFEKIYGSKWKFLNSEVPYNAMLIKGSDVVLYDKTTV